MNDFTKTLQWIYLTEKKNHLKSLIGMAVCFFAIIFLGDGRIFSLTEPVNPQSHEVVAILCSIGWMVAIMVMAARTFRKLQKKQYRSMFMMLPASNSNKYWASILTTVLVSTVGILCSLLCADALQMLLELIFAGQTHSVAAVIFRNIIGAKLSDIWIVFLITMWSVTSYWLGATLFRKNHFLFTTFAWNVIGTAILCIVGGIMALIINMHEGEQVSIEFFFDEKLTATIFVHIITIGFSIFNILMSYRIFKRMQVVGGKIFN